MIWRMLIVHGFTPIMLIDGSPYNGAVRKYPVDSSNATAIFVGDAITLEDDGNVTPAAAGGIVLGVCTGVVVNRSVAATEHPGYLPASTAGYIYVAVGPDVLYEVQEDGVGGALAATNIGNNIDLIAGTGSTTTGRSAHEIDSNTATAAGSAQFRIVDYVHREDNDITAVNSKWIVRVFESHWTTTNGI